MQIPLRHCIMYTVYHFYQYLEQVVFDFNTFGGNISSKLCKKNRFIFPPHQLALFHYLAKQEIQKSHLFT